ncbi:hypothetical protein JKP88DRAFT_163563 [Tribonema minus]|uniref:Uncharacterized protein n=1 Tax=Tribonema minus TaxID=303371 RepID=A0A835Z2W4_9STRA|nr:hypothetical protein JKP88DRAFT_163563 [Tribonema minus]
MALVSKQFLEVAEEIGEVHTKSADIEGRLALLEWAQYNGLPRRMKLRVAANGGHLQLLRKMSPFSDWEASIVGKGAAEGGHLNVLDWIGRRGWDRVCEAAAGKCKWHVVQWALGNGLKPDSSVVVAAAQAGETSLMARALSGHTYWQRMDEAYAASRAIAAGRLDALQWALDHADIIPPKPAYVAWDFCPAAENGHINILQWAKDTHRRAPSTMQKWALAAATGGQVRVISWLAKANMIDIPDFVSVRAAQQGRVDVLRWLHDSGSMFIADDIFEIAAKAGQLEVVAWGLESGYGVRSGVLEAAAAEGHFDILKWAHVTGVPFTEGVLRGAIDCGKLNIIKWLCKHKCAGWDRNLAAMANMYTRQIVKKWLVLNNTRARRTARGARK